MRTVGRLLRWGAVLGALVFALTLGAVLWTAAGVRAQGLGAAALAVPVDAAIVLGAGVDGDGRLGYSSRRRVAGAVELLEAGGAEHLIFSGGLGGNHPARSAGRMMRDLALEMGADPARLHVEGRSISTFENLLFSFPIADGLGADRLALVSDPWHLPRAGRLAEVFGRDVALVGVAGTERDWWVLQAAWQVREALAWWLNLLKVVGWWGLGALGLSEADRVGIIR